MGAAGPPLVVQQLYAALAAGDPATIQARWAALSFNQKVRTWTDCNYNQKQTLFNNLNINQKIDLYSGNILDNPQFTYLLFNLFAGAGLLQHQANYLTLFNNAAKKQIYQNYFNFNQINQIAQGGPGAVLNPTERLIAGLSKPAEYLRIINAGGGAAAQALADYNAYKAPPNGLANIQTIWNAWTDMDLIEQRNIWAGVPGMNDQEQTVLYDAKLQLHLAQPVSLTNAINDAFNAAQAQPAAQAFQQYIANNQAALTQRYGFSIPVNDTSYLYRHVDVPQAEQGIANLNNLAHSCNPKFYGTHAHNMCQSTTNALAYVLRELIRNRKYMQAGEQILNCLNKRLDVMVRFGGGDINHRRVVGVLFQLEDIINRAGIENIGNMQVVGADLQITLNAAQPRRFREVVVPVGPPRQIAGIPTAPGVAAPAGVISDVGIASWVGTPYFPGEFVGFERNVQGGKRKTRHAKKSKKSKTRKH